MKEFARAYLEQKIQKSKQEVSGVTAPPDLGQTNPSSSAGLLPRERITPVRYSELPPEAKSQRKLDGSVIPDSWRLKQNEVPKKKEPPPPPVTTTRADLLPKNVPSPEEIPESLRQQDAATKNYKMKQYGKPDSPDELHQYRRQTRHGLKPEHLKRRQALAVSLTPEEEYQIRSYIYTNNFRSISDFIRKSIFYVMHTNIGAKLVDRDDE